VLGCRLVYGGQPVEPRAHPTGQPSNANGRRIHWPVCACGKFRGQSERGGQRQEARGSLRPSGTSRPTRPVERTNPSNNENAEADPQQFKCRQGARMGMQPQLGGRQDGTTARPPPSASCMPLCANRLPSSLATAAPAGRAARSRSDERGSRAALEGGTAGESGGGGVPEWGRGQSAKNARAQCCSSSLSARFFPLTLYPLPFTLYPFPLPPSPYPFLHTRSVCV
jgi:hypothetical protein